MSFRTQRTAWEQSSVATHAGPTESAKIVKSDLSFDNAFSRAFTSLANTKRAACTGANSSRLTCGVTSIVTDTGTTALTALSGRNAQGNVVGTGAQMFAIAMTGLDASGAGASSRIVIGSALSHVVNRHTIDGARSMGASTFAEGVDIAALIKKAEATAPTLQRGGNYQRIVTSEVNIGIDRVTGALTRQYTVITDSLGNLVTAFPGKP